MPDVFDQIQPEGDVFDKIAPQQNYLGAADIPVGGGEVKEYTGERLTKTTRIAPRETGKEFKVEDKILPGITNKMVEDRAGDLWKAAGETTPWNPDIDEHWINAKLELMEEKIAEKHNVSPEEIEGYVNDYMFVSPDDDPESLLAGMVTGTHKYNQAPEFNPLTDELLELYMNQGYSEEEVRDRYRDRKKIFDRQWAVIRNRSSKRGFREEAERIKKLSTLGY